MTLSKAPFWISRNGQNQDHITLGMYSSCLGLFRTKYDSYQFQVLGYERRRLDRSPMPMDRGVPVTQSRVFPSYLAGHDFIGFACSLDAFHLLLIAPVLSADFHLLFTLEKERTTKTWAHVCFHALFVCQNSEITP